MDKETADTEPGILLTPHPIQLTHMGVRQLFIKANVIPSESVDVDEVEPEMSLGFSNYEPEQRTISVAVKLEIGKGKEESPPPFRLIVEVVGQFLVDDKAFPVDRLDEWVKGNALYIFHPYLREHVFALTARCGFPPLLLPLVEVPTFKLSASLKSSVEPEVISQ